MTSQPERPPPQPPTGAKGTLPETVCEPDRPVVGLIVAVKDLSLESEQALSRAVVDQNLPTGQAAEIFVACGAPVRELVSLQCAGPVRPMVTGKRHARFMGDVLVPPLNATALSHANASEQEAAWT